MTHMITIGLVLIVLHSLDGREVNVSIDEITSIQCKLSVNKLVHKDVRAIVNLTDGKFVSVQESCEDIKAMLQNKGK